MNLELAIQTLRDNGYTVTKRKPKVNSDFADYDMSKVKNAKVAFPSPVIAATFENGEYIRMSFATTVGKPLNVGRAVRVAVDAYDARHKIRERKEIAARFANEIETHEHVTSKKDHRDEMRANAIEAAEALEAHRDTPRPDYISGWNVLGGLSEFQKARNAESSKWGYRESELARTVETCLERYDISIAHVAHAKDYVLKGLLKKHTKRVKVPAITNAHIEIAGKKLPPLDLEKVNATARAKVNGGLH